jgi:ABC-type amino acid transport substrate-binding protein
MPIFQLNPNDRKTKSSITMRLATILVITILMVGQPASGARAGSIALQLPTHTGQLPNAPATTLTVATSADYEPMEYINGTQIVGHDIDLMNAIAAKMNVTVVYTNIPFGQLLDGLVAGNYDAVISTLSVTPTRENIIDFTLPYVTFTGNDNIAIAVQKGNNPLKQQINEALRQLRTDGTLQAIIAGIATDKPEWQPRLPVWERVFLPLVLR